MLRHVVGWVPTFRKIVMPSTLFTFLRRRYYIPSKRLELLTQKHGTANRKCKMNNVYRHSYKSIILKILGTAVKKKMFAQTRRHPGFVRSWSWIPLPLECDLAAQTDLCPTFREDVVILCNKNPHDIGRRSDISKVCLFIIHFLIWSSALGRQQSSDHLIIKQDNHYITTKYTRDAVTYIKHISLPVHRLNVMLVVWNKFRQPRRHLSFERIFLFYYYILNYLFGLLFPCLPKQSCVSFSLRDCLRNWIVGTKTPPPQWF
jgi:hypothetical protein